MAIEVYPDTYSSYWYKTFNVKEIDTPARYGIPMKCNFLNEESTEDKRLIDY